MADLFRWTDAIQFLAVPTTPCCSLVTQTMLIVRQLTFFIHSHYLPGPVGVFVVSALDFASFFPHHLLH
jgi:hypothetical protein